jgi:hypothetical protein
MSREDPRVTCCEAFSADAVVECDPDYWSSPVKPRAAWCIQTPHYGDVYYYEIKFCPWCGTKLPALEAP